MTEKEIDALAYDMMAEFRKSVQNEHLHPWVAYHVGVKAGYKAAMEEIEKLNEQVKLLENTVAFYADRNNWQLVPFTGEVKEVIVMSDLGCKIYNGENDFRDYELSSGGRRAREALQKLEEVREKK